MAGEQPNVTATAPQVDTQNMPVDGQLQAPAAPTPVSVQSPAPAPAPPPGHSFRHLAPAMIGAILGQLAGTPGPTYKTDDSGKMIAVPAAPLSTGDKLKRIAANALTGLAASSEVPPQKSGLASALAGAGAGEKAVQEKQEKQDILKRAQEKENFEQEQQTKLRKYEVMRQNALTMSTYFENKKRLNDLNPIFAQNESLYNAVKNSPELQGHVTEMSSEQVEQAHEKDPDFLTTHIVKPMGWVPDTDAAGNPVMETGEDGIQVPKMSMRMAVIDGTKDGKLAITPEMAADFKKYGPMARIPNAGDIQAGQEYDFNKIVPLMNAVDEQRKAVLEGWQHAELGWSTDPKTGKESPVEINKVLPPGDPDRVRPLTVTPLDLKAAQDKSDLEKAQAKEAYDKGQESLANAAMISKNLIGGNDQNSLPAYMDAIKQLPPQSQSILRSVPPSQQMALLAVATGDEALEKAFPTRVTAKSGQVDAQHALNLIKVLNPEWNAQMYNTVQKLTTDFYGGGEAGKAINSFNQFFGHAGQAADVVRQWKTTNSPLANKSINWLRANMAGDPQVTRLLAALEPVKDEWLTMVKSGKAADVNETERANKFLNENLTADTLLGNLKAMGEQGVTRIDQLNEEWKQVKHQNAPNLIRQTGMEGATKLGIGDQLKKYDSGGTLRGTNMGQPQGTSQTPPPGATHKVPGPDGKTHWTNEQGTIDYGVAE